VIPSKRLRAKRLIGTVLSALIGAATFGAQGIALRPRDVPAPRRGVARGRGPTGPVSLLILSPRPHERLSKGPVRVQLALSGYPLFFDSATGTGQGVCVMLDNSPCKTFYDVSKPLDLGVRPSGTHTIRAFLVRPWGEAIKDYGSFALVTFDLGRDDGHNAPAPGGPLLTYNGPEGVLTGAAAGKVLLDFYLSGVTLSPKGWRVRYWLDGRPTETVSRLPVWWEHLPGGVHHVRLELLRPDGSVDPGAFNTTARTFEIQ
jgi:hypothetical protein